MIRIRFYQLAAILLWIYAPRGWPVETGPVIDVDYRELAEGYAHLITFTAEPEIAAGRYTIDSEDPIATDSTLKMNKLPCNKEFTSDKP